ncbi:RNA polymerase sigma factor [Proteiniphilum sp. X52]|uniref:RNA polymerase sigma factor n=1 Tax=Proteiniphilum sp. X52 TaxID=2382159 RepID=UPI000F09EF1E|nr:sigma-70 family RNA polymerase sigma factor [Proteiniphilum sp. X52]RNC63736.1 sigma-70 family RNA polymerase sigma factor [Proteiniphilum sp. X52]
MEGNKKEHAFVKIVQEHERIIYKVCSFYVSDTFPLADLYQEVVCNLWRSFPKFRNESSPGTWIYRIALNTCISGIRKEKKRPKCDYTIEDLSDWFIEQDSLNENIREMYLLINRLKTLEKVVVLLYLEEKSYQEIADITGLTLSNVATKLKRAKEKLREMSHL